MRKTNETVTSLTGFAEDELLSRARRLDRYALGELHERYYPQVYPYVYFRLGDEPASQDIAAEVFLRFLEAARRRRGPRRDLSAWLLSTAARLVDERLQAGGENTSRHSERPSLLDHLPGLDDQEAQLQTLQARQALQSLPPDLQHFLALRFACPCTLEEASARLEKAGGDTRGLQFRALSALRRALEKSA
ncbi:MAG: sigma-70 family RNA polymerase sigma factor [Chloroflexota bacterium]